MTAIVWHKMSFRLLRFAGSAEVLSGPAEVELLL